MAVLFLSPFLTGLDDDGTPLVPIDPSTKATIQFYQAGTTTPLDTYSDAAFATANTNPVVLDGSGRFPVVYLLPAPYKAVFKRADGTTITTLDNIDGTGGLSGVDFPVSSIADIRALDTGDFHPTSIQVAGYYGAETPGGGRFYRIDGTFTADDDDGGSLIVTADGVGYRRSGYALGSFRLSEWGARGVGTTTDIKTSNGTALRQAMKLFATLGYGELHFDPITYLCSWQRTLYDGTPADPWSGDAGDTAGAAILFQTPPAAKITLRGQKGTTLQIDTVPKGRLVQMVRHWDTTTAGSLDAHSIWLTGDMDSHDNTDTGFSFMGWDFRGARNVTRTGCGASKCWGDGTYIGKSENAGLHWSESIQDYGHWEDNARRNGMSIVSCKNYRSVNGKYSNSGSTYSYQPMAGVDIEANVDPDAVLENIVFDSPTTWGNAGGGLYALPNGLVGSGATISIVVNNHWSVDDGIGFRLESQEGVRGDITFNRPLALRSRGAGCYLRRPYGGSDRVNLRVHYPTIIDSNTGGWADAINSSAIAILRGDTPLTSPDTIGGVIIQGATIIDTRPTPDLYVSGTTYATDAVVLDRYGHVVSYRATTGGTTVGPASAWQAAHSYALNDIVIPTGTAAATLQYRLTASAGTSGASEPTWPAAVAGTVTDNGMTWTAENRLFDGILGRTYQDGDVTWICERLYKIGRPLNVNDLDGDIQSISDFRFLDPIQISGCVSQIALRRGTGGIVVDDKYDQLVNRDSGAYDLLIASYAVYRTYVDDNWPSDRNIYLPLERGSGQKWSVRKSTTKKATIYPAADPGAWTANTAINALNQVRPTAGWGDWVLWATSTGVSGYVQAGSGTTITLPTSASSVDGAYVGAAYTIQAGTGRSQSGKITGYVGATRVATIDTALTTALDTTSYLSVQGVTGATEPSWTLTDGATTTDGTVTWTARAAPQIDSLGIGVSIYSSDPHGEIEFQNTGISQHIITKIKGRWFVTGTDEPLGAISSTDDLPEGSAHLYYTDARAASAAGGLVTTNGLVARTASATYAGRTLQGLSGLFTWTNGDGVAGNPTPVLANPASVVGLNVSGNLLVGGQTSSVNGGPVDFATNASSSPLGIARFNANGIAARVNRLISRAATIGGHATMVSGDGLYSDRWIADDGTNFVVAATMDVDVAAAVSTGVVPTTVTMKTTTAAGALAAGLKIGADQSLAGGSGAGVTFLSSAGHHRNRSYTIATLPSATAAEQIYCSDLGGGAGLLESDGTNWKRMRPTGYAAVATDAAFTLTALTSAPEIRHTGTLTADRTVTLSTTGAYAGLRFRVTRTGTGAFNLSLGGLKNLVTNTWAEVTFDGSAWYLSAYGAL